MGRLFSQSGGPCCWHGEGGRASPVLWLLSRPRCGWWHPSGEKFLGESTGNTVEDFQAQHLPEWRDSEEISCRGSLGRKA